MRRRNAPDRIAALAADPLLKGLRPMLQDIADTDWILRPDVQPALAAMTQTGLRFDALVQPRHLPVLLDLLRAPPDPARGDRPRRQAGHRDRARSSPGRTISPRVARETAAFCKLSGLVTEARARLDTDWTDLRRYTSTHLLACFGPHRLMWGSDWPVVNLAGGYARWREASLALLRALPRTDQDAILGGTAAAFYGFGASRRAFRRRPEAGKQEPATTANNLAR